MWLFVQAVTEGLHNLVIFILKADNKGTEKSLLKPLEWEEETGTWRTTNWARHPKWKAVSDSGYRGN